MNILNTFFNIINHRRIQHTEKIIKGALTSLGFSNVYENKEDQNYALTIRKVYDIVYIVAKKLHDEENKHEDII